MVRVVVLGTLLVLLGCASTQRNAGEAAGGQSEAGANAGEGGQAGTAGSGGSWPVLGDSPAEACLTFELAACERRDACGSPPTFNCLLETRQCPDSAFAAGTTLTAPGLKACADAWKQLPCARVLAGELPACVTPGTVPDGGTCQHGSQCESLYYEPGEQDCGVCAPKPVPEPDPPRPREGEACQIELGCSRGLYCGGPAESGTCFAFNGAGESCDDYQFCAPLLYCSLQGECLVGPGDGEECALAGAQPEQFYVCGRTFACDESVSPPRCQKSGQLGTGCRFSEECGEGLQCGCPAGANCVTTSCLYTRFAGESCADGDSVCHPAFACQAGRCTPRDMQGNLCLP